MCDGASSNRRLWQVHKEDKKKSKTQTTRDPQSNGNAEDNRMMMIQMTLKKSFCTKFRMHLLQMDPDAFIFLTQHIY